MPPDSEILIEDSEVAAEDSLGGRLHPAVLVIWPFNQVVPLAFLAMTEGPAAIIAVAGLALSVLAGLVRWLRFRWRLEGGALVIEQGLLSRSRRVIPFERIQSVDLVRKVRHRIFGVVEVRVEAVGGSETEGRLDALTTAQAERLRSALLTARRHGTGERPSASEPARGEELVAMRPARLLLAGITGGRIGVAAALLGLTQQLFGERLDELVGDLPDLFSPAGFATLAVALLALSFVLSVIVTVVAYWDFRLVRDGVELRVRRGLLEQRLETIPLRRIQAVQVEENLLRRPFGLAAVRVDTAGKSGGQDVRDSGLLLPLGSRAQAFALVANVIGVAGVDEVQLAPMPGRARRRRLVRAAVVTLVPTVAATALAGPPGLLAALIGVPAVTAALDSYRALGSARVGDIVVGRSGVLVRRTAFVPVRNLQSLALTATPFQRASDLATVELQIAGARAPRLVDLDRAAGEGAVTALQAALLAGSG